MKKGFTLIELLVVLVIIGIIIGLILPNTLKAINEANKKECVSNIRTIDTAIQMCYTKERDWTACNTIALLTSANPPYLESAPVCPFGVAYTPTLDAATQGYRVDTTEHFSVWPPVGVDHE